MLQRRRVLTLLLSNLWLPNGEIPLGLKAPPVEGTKHAFYMKQAIALGKRNPRYPFGAVLVDREKDSLVSEGWNKSSQNPLLHGEIDAIENGNARSKLLKREVLALYTTAEPCAMCQGAILWAGISFVAYGTSIPFLKKLGWETIDIPAQEIAARTSFQKCAFLPGVLEDECNALFVSAVNSQAH
jgi:tRNA(adenine34) deaminase